MLKKWHISTAYLAWTKEEEGEDAWMEFMSPHFQEVAYLSSGADPLLVQTTFLYLAVLALALPTAALKLEEQYSSA